MKIQCSCGAKFEFEITPDMAQGRVRFVCSSCGLDGSEFVDRLVRQELAQPAPAQTTQAAAQPPGPVQVRIHTPAAASRNISATPQLASALHVRPSTPQRADTETPTEQPASAETCSKHFGELTTEKCYICSKPIRPK